MTDVSNPSKGQPRLVEAALSGLCPRCGGKTLFAGMARFSDRCRSCGLDFSRFNVGDGPAAFLTLGVGAIVTVFAVWLELAASPPFWVHALVWLPLIVVGVIGGLRVTKAALLIREYRADAYEHRHDGSDLT